MSSADDGANPTAARPWRAWDRGPARDDKQLWRSRTKAGISLTMSHKTESLRLSAVRGHDQSGTKYPPR